MAMARASAAAWVRCGDAAVQCPWASASSPKYVALPGSSGPMAAVMYGSDGRVTVAGHQLAEEADQSGRRDRRGDRRYARACRASAP